MAVNYGLNQQLIIWYPDGYLHGSRENPLRTIIGIIGIGIPSITEYAQHALCVGLSNFLLSASLLSDNEALRGCVIGMHPKFAGMSILMRTVVKELLKPITGEEVAPSRSSERKRASWHFV